MKRILILLTAAFLLVACGKDEKEAETKAAEPVEEKEVVEVSDEKDEEKEAVEVSDEKDEKKEIDDVDVTEEDADEEGKLTKVGQKIKDADQGTTVELMATKSINDIIDLDPVKLTIKDIKIIRMSDIKNQDLLYSFSQFTDKEEFDYIQIQYEIENTKDINVRLNSPLEAVVLNTGEQIVSFEKDISGDPNFAKTLYGKVKNESMVALVIEKTDPEDIEEIKIVTGRIDDADSGSTLVDEKTTVYEME